ncbi:MAG: hypothetical protein KGM24_04775 [Elusimicrobia bacterium]|nr:hypothetical protein [Elusimicrobiota bacterium]
MRLKLVLLALSVLAALPARAGDWLDDAQWTAATTAIPGAPPPPPGRGTDWIPYDPPSRLFSGLLPPKGWRPYETEDALGTVDRILGPDDPSGLLRATLSVRYEERDSPGFLPARDAVAAMRRSGPDRSATPVMPLRLEMGLARIFEVTLRRRLPLDAGPSRSLALHEYVAVIPRGEDYFVVRLLTTRGSYLDYKSFFVRFLKELRALGGGR